MSGYRLQYAPDAAAARAAMNSDLRERFDAGMTRITADPYGCDSAPIGKEEDRREATVSGVVIRYYVSRPVLIVTVVRVIYV